MSFVVAYAFTTRLPLVKVPDLLRHLRAHTTFDWIERDSDLWGEYVSTNVASPHAVAMIFPPDDYNRYNVEVKFFDDALRDTWEKASDALLQQFLPHLEATDVEYTIARN